MIFISGILYLLALILGFFIKIPTYILIFLMFLFFISALREKDLIYRGKKTRRNKILALSILIFATILLSIIQDKLNIDSFTFLNDNQRFHIIYLALSYIVLNFIIDGVTFLNEK